MQTAGADDQQVSLASSFQEHLRCGADVDVADDGLGVLSGPLDDDVEVLPAPSSKAWVSTDELGQPSG